MERARVKDRFYLAGSALLVSLLPALSGGLAMRIEARFIDYR